MMLLLIINLNKIEIFDYSKIKKQINQKIMILITIDCIKNIKILVKLLIRLFLIFYILISR